LVGLVFAAIGVFASNLFVRPELDGLASMAIGVLLAGVALLLIRESRGLLVGEGLAPQFARELRSYAAGRPGVREAGPVLSMYMGPDDVLVTLDIRIEPDLASADIERTVRDFKAEVRRRCPDVTRIYVDITAPAD
jgi:divalent metal cation (Fe/Co/Zn/Cd) transporter